MRGLIVIALICCALAVMLHSAKAQGGPQSAPMPHPSGNKGLEGRYRREAQGGGGGGGSAGAGGGFGFGFNMGGGAGAGGQAGGEGGK
ncbi:PREDICTED: putative glycine-rich cell wall structural protein 1 isoform X1 [Rhagoletis zephyria]|uniref:putative glycine-rich cell wall structural protein 1 isoform X1 n=1 Tax=Rhagoletis zephyria TaxID=28612 RepID=UPI000811444A|nr:PREDICTED: putative glycine-rich cell wall structural protein 1 isoform X1 [Rhagoletis zephyria]